MSVKNEKIDEILDQLFAVTDVVYTITDRKIILAPSFLSENEQQQKTVSGKVTDNSGQPSPGVTVVIKGTMQGTVTNVDGNYSLPNIPDNATLVFSFVGMRTQEVVVGSQTNINISLAVDAIGLEEVVAIGYGTVKKGSVTGSMGKVSTKDITSAPVSTLSQTLQGRVAGVRVTNNGGPGTSPTVQIRGVGSINFNSDPLYVVDGVPTESFSSISTNDVQSMDILKDASATAIYGSRGSNGVVIITTKKGKSNDKFDIEYNGSIGTQAIAKKLDLLNREEYLSYGKDLLQNAGLALPARWSQLNTPIYAGTTQTFGQTDTDWQDAMFHSATIQEHNISVAGGGAKSKFYTSAGLFSQDGVMVGTNYKRYNARLNSTHELSKRITFGETFNIANSENSVEKYSGERPQVMQMVRAVPYFPVLDPTLDGGYRGPDGIDGTDFENPVRIALQPTSINHNFNLLGTAFLEIKLTDWLKFKSTVGLDYTSGRVFSVSPTFKDGTYHAQTYLGLSDNRISTFSKLITNQFTADKSFGNHNINAVLVAEQSKSESYWLNGGGKLPDNTVQQLSNPTGITLAGGMSEEALISYIGRIQYAFANKYLFGTSYRADGSSKFAPGNKWGFFKSFSAGWRIKNESFLKNISAISDLKLRASYGETGFNGIGNYVWQSNESVNGAYYMLNGVAQQASFFNQLGNLNLKWETTRMSNFGFDLKLLDNSLSVSAEYYNRITDNLILNVQPAPSLGYTQSTSTNIGKMSNKGFELQVGYDKQIGRLHMNVSGNISTNANKVLGLDLPSSVLYSKALDDFGGDPITRTKEGESIQQFYGYVTDGIFQNQTEIDNANASVDGNAATLYQNAAKPGDIRFKDISGKDGNPDGKIDNYDKTVIGSYLPKFQYGFNIALEYNGFDFTAFLQGSYGNDIFNANKITMEGMSRLFNAGANVLNAWTPTNTNTNIPRAVSGDPNKNARVSDRWIEDGSFLRLKNVTIGYTVPTNWLRSVSKNNISKLRLYVSSQNLLTFTKYSGYDPEIGKRAGFGDAVTPLMNGIDYGQYPQARNFVCGIQVGF
jgi:TonB-linked SusC/RagA family outer membrane protein